ncbi:hypothetical protein [Aquimarina muelleri]|uniref:Uncharacterized protein n=1 Tax=Aquimarina muelleri TaxID=279356 RepID=A0A918JU80_9FLAO|nr:hypothetical protein [Aquimarina muelleri]MCX2761350.1 hypothetical protein [Aquimarina muelleri]GGX12797.1 hypothetical protein GCM10007384_13250 [Aquimarina muelleri]
MKAKKYYKHQKEFISSIVMHFHIDINDFKDCIQAGKCYECLLYQWSIRLYKKGVPVEEAIQIIYRTRIFVLRDKAYNRQLRKAMYY